MDRGPWANRPKKRPSLPVYTSIYTQIFFIPNTKPIIQAVGKQHLGPQGPSNERSKHHIAVF